MKQFTQYQTNTRKVSPVEDAAGTAIATFIACIFVYGIFEFFKKLTSGLRNPQVIADETIAKYDEIILTRHFDRIRYSGQSPVTRGSRGDPEYKDWYASWLRGEVIDSELLWAPEVYDGSLKGSKTFNENFFNYLEIQIGLHRKAGMERHLEGTIRKFYPELTPDLNAIHEDIEEIRERIAARKIQKEIRAELVNTGLTEESAKIISKMDLRGKNLKSLIPVVKRFIEAGFNGYDAVYFADKGYKVTEPVKQLLSLFSGYNVSLNRSVWEPLMSGSVSPDKFVSLIKEVTEAIPNAFIQYDRNEMLNNKMALALANLTKSTPVWERT